MPQSKVALSSFFHNHSDCSAPTENFRMCTIISLIRFSVIKTWYLFLKSSKHFVSKQSCISVCLLGRVLLLLIFYSNVRAASSRERVYINRFAVHIHQGDQQLADEIALKHNYINLGQVGNLKGHFVFKHQSIRKRSIEYSYTHHRTLKNEPKVLWVEQQHEKRRVKREDKAGSRISLRKFNDPLYSEQWYLHKGAYGGNDMNVAPVWEEGITGKGVVVTILDDGIQTNHPDLVANYDPLASIDINDQDDDPMPQDNGNNKHGTRCAGEVAAVASNGFCGVGIAYNASIGGVRMLDGSVTDEVEARALSLNPHHIDIYSASWGPEDDGKTVDGPGRLAKRAFVDGISFGRKGLGSIFVWASGNGGRHQDNCNCDGYTNSIYSLSISSATQAGAKPWYLEECSSTLTTTYSSGTPKQDENIVTVDMDTSYFRDLQNQRTPNPASLCTKSHTGTSASAPIAAAICALALEANSKLTWRDMQHLVVLTSRPDPLSREDGWVVNGVGRKVNHKFGYGLMDASAMVKLAKRWITVPLQRACHTPLDKQERIIPIEYGDKMEVVMVTNGCHGTSDNVRYLEHVQVVLTLQFQPRGNLHIVLISPSGTASSVLFPRPFDSVESAITNWPFLSVHFWGENPVGQWKLVIINEGRHKTIFPGKLKEWSLIFYGTEQHPSEVFRNSFIRQTAENPCFSQGMFQMADQPNCLSECPQGFHADNHHVCQKCSPHCETCYGPGQDHCLTCPKQMFLSKEDSCIEYCPTGQFGDVPTGDCLPCTSSCSTCSNLADLCQACKPGFFLYQQHCIFSCPPNTYRTQDARCNDCSPNCVSCKGPQDYDCLSCAMETYLLNGTCTRNCPKRHYADISSRICVRCSAGCEVCDNDSSGGCKSCKSGWMLTDNYCLPQNEHNCLNGEYFDEDKRKCTLCHSSCNTCSGPGQNECVTCPKNKFLKLYECLNSCPLATFLDDSQETCLSCPPLCSHCNNSEQCLTCNSGTVLQDNDCRTSCKEKWFFSTKALKCLPCDISCSTCTGARNTDCTSCNFGNYLLSGRCRSECPKGFHGFFNGENKQCLPCHHLCASCSGPGPKACISCHKNAVLLNNVCYTCALNEYYNENQQRCLPCHSTCSQCNGGSITNCQACAFHLRLQPETNTCLPCCQFSDSTNSEQQIIEHTDCCLCKQNSELCDGYSDKTRSISGQHLTNENVPFEKLPGGNNIDSGIRIPMKHVIPAVIAICVSAVILFFVMFGFLQTRSTIRWPCGTGANYKRIPVAHYDGNSEKVALTSNDYDEEDDLFEKT